MTRSEDLGAAVARAFDREPSSGEFDAAFGGSGSSAYGSDFDRAVARAFGRTSHEDEALMRELQEAGASGAGARGVLRWLEDGVSVEEACRFGINTGTGTQNGKVPSLVVERATAIVRRYRPDLAGTSQLPAARVPATESSSGIGAPESARVAEAREEFVQAAIDEGRRYLPSADEAQRRRIAEAAACGAVESLTEWAMRDAWTEDELVARIREHAAAIRAEATAPARPAARTLPRAAFRESSPPLRFVDGR